MRADIERLRDDSVRRPCGGEIGWRSEASAAVGRTLKCQATGEIGEPENARCAERGCNRAWQDEAACGLTSPVMIGERTGAGARPQCWCRASGPPRADLPSTFNLAALPPRHR